MKIVYSPLHQQHAERQELLAGQLVACYEKPERVEAIRAALAVADLGPIIPATAHGLEAVLRVHDADYVDLLATAWEEWQAAQPGSEQALPYAFPMGGGRPPREIEGRLGYYAFDLSAAITAGTWAAVRAAVDVTLTARELVLGGETALALCRPPGHHAGPATMGGYCYLNNAAIAAQAFRDGGAARVAILDVDYHHGNGSQAIFYERPDVLFVSIHADPAEEYPDFWGYADEIGAAEGEGYNLNLPLPRGTDWSVYQQALGRALAAVSDYRPDYLVVSLGLDTHAADPIAHFELATEDYLPLGQRIGELGLPTLFVLEGGYALEAIGPATVNVLRGLEGS